MIYVKFPHPALLTDPTYLDWVHRVTAGMEPNWTELFDWLAMHTRIAWQGVAAAQEGQPKCWYSEAPILGGFVKDVEHFRPKGEAIPLTNPQRKKLEAQLEFPFPEKKDKEAGYDWLKFDPLNYRLSHPEVNRAGGKGAVFPVYVGTHRITVADDPATFKEFAFLIDPTRHDDEGLLAVTAAGQILPVYGKEPLPQGLSPEELWQSPAIKHIRAAVSIVVYRLDEKDWVRARWEAYHEMLQNIEALENALVVAKEDWVNRELKQLLKKLMGLSPFALTSRCAAQSYVQLNRDVQEKIPAVKRLQTLLDIVREREH